VLRCSSWPTSSSSAAPGKTGRRLVQQLTAAGHAPRAAARHGAVHFDWDDRATWAAALAGAEAVYVVPPALRGDYVPDVEAFLAQAREAGVRRAVLLSARGADAGPAPEQNPLYAAEQVLAASGLSWSVVRPSWFMQNFTEGFMVPDAEGRIRLPAGDGRVPFIDAEDIAAVAAAALTQDGHEGQVYELAGPELLDHHEAAAALGATYEDVPPEAWQAAVQEAGMPAEYAAVLAMLFSFIRDGYEARPSDGVQRALGREPGAFAAFAAR
jgi:uncharacterized protein YbjT (DUF2867 family)